MPLSEFEYLSPFRRYRGFSLFLVAKRPFFIVLKQIGAVFAGFVLEIKFVATLLQKQQEARIGPFVKVN